MTEWTMEKRKWWRHSLRGRRRRHWDLTGPLFHLNSQLETFLSLAFPFLSRQRQIACCYPTRANQSQSYMKRHAVTWGVRMPSYLLHCPLITLGSDISQCYLFKPVLPAPHCAPELEEIEAVEGAHKHDHDDCWLAAWDNICRLSVSEAGTNATT